MGVSSLPKTVTRQRRGCDLNLDPSAPESSTLTTRPPEPNNPLSLNSNRDRIGERMIFGGRGGANVGSLRRTCRWIFYRRCRRRRRLLGHIMMATVLGFRAQSMFSCRVRPTTTSTLPDRYRARPGVGALWHPVLSTADLRVEHLVTSPSLIIVDVFTPRSARRHRTKSQDTSF